MTDTPKNNIVDVWFVGYETYRSDEVTLYSIPGKLTAKQVRVVNDDGTVAKWRTFGPGGGHRSVIDREQYENHHSSIEVALRSALMARRSAVAGLEARLAKTRAALTQAEQIAVKHGVTS